MKTTYVYVKNAEGGIARYIKGEEPWRVNTDRALWGDRGYEGMRAPDGADIGSRTKHREYMRRHGVATVDDFKDTWAKAQERRDAYRTAGAGGAVTRDDIARAIARQER